MRKWLGVLGLVLLASVAYGTTINPWNTTFDSGRPSNATTFGSIDDEILDAKQSTRARLDIDHAFSSLNGSGDTSNSGRHLPGSAVSFVVNADTACSTIAAMPRPDLNGLTTIPEGSLCVDKADKEVCVYSSGWQCSAMVPSGLILLSVSGSCPTGFTDVSGNYDALTMRVADVGATTAAIPDTAGTLCDGTNCGGGAASQYTDTLTTNEMPAHTHNVTTTDSGSGDGVVFDGRDPANGTSTTSSAGSGAAHFHRFFTVRLCQRN